MKYTLWTPRLVNDNPSTFLLDLEVNNIWKQSVDIILCSTADILRCYKHRESVDLISDPLSKIY